MSKQAVILCGGKGTRLRPYTVVLPKPLMPIGEFPILEVIIKQLAKQGYSKIVLAVNHQSELIRAFFGNGKKWGIEISYSKEDKPLSTMGPLKLLKDLDDNFLVMNGDILTDLDYGKFFDNHVIEDNIFTISSFKRTHVNDYGVLDLNEKNELIKFREKPTTSFEVSMGIYMLNKRVLDFIPPDTFYGFDHLMYELIKTRNYASVVTHEGYWLDIGRPDDYMIAIEEFANNLNKFL